MELPCLGALLTMITVTGVICGGEESLRSETALVEARYDRYYDVFRYWWPWFSDLTTVVAIKLKIWVILVAMLVFGDGYYWSKWSGTSIFEKSQWAQNPAAVSWGRRKRRSTQSNDVDRETDLAELIFDTLDITDDACRKRVVCELYLEGQRLPELWRAMHAPGYEVFGAYRPKDVVFSSSDCRKLSPRCPITPRKGSSQTKLTDNEGTDGEWRWPR